MTKQITSEKQAVLDQLSEFDIDTTNMKEIDVSFLNQLLQSKIAEREAQAKAREAHVQEFTSKQAKRAYKLLCSSIEETSSAKATYALIANPTLSNKEVLEVAEIRGAFNLADLRTTLKILYQENLLDSTYAAFLESQMK